MAKSAIICIVLFVFSQISWANIPVVDPTNVQTQAKLEFLKNFKGKNEIKLLNNRFRVDHEVEEVMMLFFRQHGSAPVVLVRPDGSKIYPRDANAKTIEWHADLGYDLIKLKQPMPGPWQAVGKILSDSKVLVLTDIELLADNLPSPIFQYETIKAEARVENSDQIISDKNFREVIKLRASLYPSQDSEQPNFGADIIQLGEFLDNGRDLDEKPRDGVFTIEYDLKVGYGEWSPKYRISTELFARELTQEPIEILPLPITYEVQKAKEGERYHYVTIMVNEELIDSESLLFEGKLLFPSRDTQQFTLSEKQSRKLEIFNPAYGTYGIEMIVYGTTKQGREFILKPPVFQFLTTQDDVAEPEIELPEMTEMPVEEEVIPVIEEEPEFPLALVIFINILILILGFLVIWLFVLKRTIPNPFKNIKFKKKKKEDDEIAPPEEIKVEKKAPDLSGTDDILDLSLPED